MRPSAVFVAVAALAAVPYASGRAAGQDAALGFPWEHSALRPARPPALAAALRAARIEQILGLSQQSALRPHARRPARVQPGAIAPTPAVTGLSWLRAGPINVSKSPLSPVLNVAYQATAGDAQIQYSLVSPSGSQLCAGDRNFVAGPGRGKIGVGDLTPYWCQAWGPWAEPGVWTLVSVTIDDSSGTTDYEGTDLAAFGLGGVMVVNPRGAIDVTPPAMLTAKLSQRTINLSATAPRVEVRYSASDNLSGIYRVYLGANTADGNNPIFLSSQSSGVLADRGAAAVSVGPASVPGVYTIEYVQVRDTAGNRREYMADELLTLFKGQATFTLVAP